MGRKGFEACPLFQDWVPHPGWLLTGWATFHSSLLCEPQGPYIKQVTEARSALSPFVHLMEHGQKKIFFHTQRFRLLLVTCVAAQEHRLAIALAYHWGALGQTTMSPPVCSRPLTLMDSPTLYEMKAH